MLRNTLSVYFTNDDLVTFHKPDWPADKDPMEGWDAFIEWFQESSKPTVLLLNKNSATGIFRQHITHFVIALEDET